MPAASQEVLEYVNSIKPGDRIKSINHTHCCSLVPNLWYTVKEITTRPYNGNISFKEILITAHGSESVYCPYWFGICDSYCQKLLPDRYNFIQVKKEFNPQEVKVGDQLLLGTNPTDWDEYVGNWLTVSGILPSIHDSGVRFIFEERPSRALHQSWFIKHKPKEVAPPEPALVTPTINKESRIKRFVNWALVEPAKKTLQYAVFASIVGGAYVAVTEPSFFLKLLPKISIKMEQ